MRKLLKQINVIILSFVLIFAPTYVLATTVAADGWSVSKRIVQGASTIYDGTKNIVLNGKNYAATGVATVTPTAAQVGKMIVRTGAVLAVDLAIKALIGAVDYVMDPANNQVIYYDSNNPTNCLFYSYIVSAGSSYKACGLEAAANLAKPYLESKDTTYKSYSLVSCSRTNSSNPNNSSYYEGTCTYSRIHKTTGQSSTTWFSVSAISNPDYSPENNKKTLPYEAVGSQIISDAVAEKSDAKAYVSSVADTALDNDESRQIVGADVVNQQLNNSQSIATNGTATGTSTPTTSDPSTPPAPPSEITLNFPVFCGWAPTVCQAAQTAINFPAKVETWIDKIFYKTEGLPQYDTQTDLYIHEQPQIKQVNINWGSVCPAPITVPLSFMGITREITVVNYQYICDYAWIIKASVNMIASISAVYIVAGRKE